MPERRDEKSDEKRGEKHEKEEEKKRGYDEKWRQNRVKAVTSATVLLWGAVVLLAVATDFNERFGWWSTWAVFLTGAGTILLLSNFFRLLIPEHRRPVGGSIILGLVLLGIGLGALVGWAYIWVIILAVIALTILLRAFLPGR